MNGHVHRRVVRAAFGHEVEVYRPTFDTVAQTVYETATSAASTKSVYEFNLLDQETKQTLPGDTPGGRVTTTAYGFGDAQLAGTPVSVMKAASTDPRGRVTTTFTDIRGNELRMDDQPLDPATPDPSDLLAPKTARYAYSPLGELLDRGRQAGLVLATLEVRKSNVGAIALYEGLGFRRVGLRKGYYVDEGEDAIVMVLDL